MPTTSMPLQVINAILTEAVLAGYEGRWVSYSRRKIFYTETKRYRGTSYTYTSVLRTIDHLAGLDLIEENRSEPGQRERQSTFHATPKLMASWPSASYLCRPHEVVLLKDAKGKLKGYKDTDQTRKWRRNVVDYNDYLRPVSLDIVSPNVVRTDNHFIIDGDKLIRRDEFALNRMFLRGSFDFYGRGHGPWQNIPREYRPQVVLNGEPVAEPDFKQIHPTMLYHQAGLSPDGDAYDINGFDRSDVKLAVLVLLNAKNYRSAFEAIKAKLDQPVSDSDVHKLIAAVKRRHAPIVKSFHSDCGIRLMRPESDIIFDVLDRCVKADIPALPIHDSVLTQDRHQSRVAEFMEASYASRFPGVTPWEIKLSCATVPHMGERGGFSSLPS